MQCDHQMIGLIIDSLVTQLEEPNAGAPGNHESSLSFLKELIDLLNPQFRYTGQLQFIDLVIRCQSRAVGLVSDGDPYQGGWLSNLGSSHLSRFRRSGDPKDLNASIAYHHKALRCTPQEDKNTPNIMCNLGNSHHARFECTGDRVDIDKAIEYYAQAMNLTSKCHPYRPAQLECLGKSYSSRFKHFGELSDIERAIDLQEQTLELAPPDHPSIPGWLNNLGCSYSNRFDRLGDLDDIHKAIGCLTHAVGLTPENHASMPAWLTTLGNSHRRRFMRGGDLDDINLAIEYQQKAVTFTPEGHAYKRLRLSGLGSSYTCRFERLGKLEDLENSIKLLSQALALGPIGSEDINLLTSLGASHGLKFERFGQLRDVDEAIRYLTQAEMLSNDQQANMPNILTSLGTTYCRRFERLAKLEDINKAVDYQKRALSLIPIGHADRGLIMSNLGSVYVCRFSHTQKGGDMSTAIETLTEAISLLPDDHTGMPIILHSLAYLYATRFKSVEDFDTAIEYQTRAVSLTPEGHAQFPNIVNSLGFHYRRLYEERGRLEDLDQAIHWLAYSVELTPGAHAKMPIRLTNLSESYLARYEIQGDLPSLYSAIQCYRRCAQHPIVLPIIQLRSAFHWAKLASIPGLPLKEDDEPIQAYQTAINLVPHVVWLGTNITQQYRDAQNITAVASSAAALAITVQRYDLALEWLEQGRSVVWSQVLQLRNPLDELAAVDPSLAAKLRQVAAELSNANQGFETGYSTLHDPRRQEEATQMHHRVAEEYQELIAAVRKLPKFHDFLRPTNVSTLARAAQTGPLVVINVDHSRCDALVIRPNTEEILHIPLPELSMDKLSTARNELEISLLRNHIRERGVKPKSKPDGKPEDIFERVLNVLWSCITKPVLDALGYAPTNEALPHITWCTTGALSFLPLHASGYYDRPQAKLVDYVISSYTPTLSTLLSATPSSRDTPRGILAVGQESTPGKSLLPGTKIELDSIRKHAHDPLVFCQLDGHHATSQAVLSAMEHYGWVHLACHAYQNTQHPTKSGFFLHDATLNLEQIARVSFQNKGLAFLSACQTATGDKELPDEAMHLASGMLIAGYSNVIATIWSIVDEDAPLIADEVYAHLLQAGRMNAGDAARALHQAVGKLREKVGDRAFYRWVPYIHMGGRMFSHHE
ncbi:CHAT domain-containing protein [Rhizoctonia solani]|nr:CHAT domain-containing protein [Rhizoctonia solani]